MIAWRAEAGFSLAELLASTALMSVLMAATLTVLVAGAGGERPGGAGGRGPPAGGGAPPGGGRGAPADHRGRTESRADLLRPGRGGDDRPGAGHLDPHSSRCGAGRPRRPHGEPGLTQEHPAGRIARRAGAR